MARPDPTADGPRPNANHGPRTTDVGPPHDSASVTCGSWSPIQLVPVARVHSPIREPREMPRGGVPCEVEVLPEYEAGLDAIETNSHLVLIGWFDRADRTKLLASPRPRGVFGIRSAVRPNPLGLTVARLLGVEGRRLRLDRLDFLDGTPIVDIKRYAPGWDCVFAATTSHELEYRPEVETADALDDLMQEAVKFHGQRTAGLALGVVALRHALVRWAIGQRDPRLSIRVGDDGAIADALQALTGARFGNGRLLTGAGPAFELTFFADDAATTQPARIRFQPGPGVPSDPDIILTQPVESLFTIWYDGLEHSI